MSGSIVTRYALVSSHSLRSTAAGCNRLARLAGATQSGHSYLVSVAKPDISRTVGAVCDRAFFKQIQRFAWPRKGRAVTDRACSSGNVPFRDMACVAPATRASLLQPAAALRNE